MRDRETLHVVVNPSDIMWLRLFTFICLNRNGLLIRFENGGKNGVGQFNAMTIK